MRPTSSPASRKRHALVVALVAVAALTGYGVFHAVTLATRAAADEPSATPSATATPSSGATTPTASDTATVPAVLDVPVTVQLVLMNADTVTAVIDPQTLAAAARPTDTGTVLDPEVLAGGVDPAIFQLVRPAADARFRIVDDSVTVVPARSGYQVTAQTLADDVARVLPNVDAAARIITLTPGEILPTFTTQQARELGITELVSSYRQAFPPATYRTINIGTAARYISGTILQPGAVFSMNDTVKERTPENGYTKGWIIGPDGVFRMEQGGAVSTITTAMFNAAWFAGLQFVEHRAHSIYIPRYPAGREATVSWGDFDMKFKNTLAHPIFITVKLHRSSVEVFFWGTKEWPEIGTVFGPWTDKSPYRTVYNTDAECHDQDGIVGFNITVWRTFIRDGAEVRREPFRTHYNPSPHVICGPAPSGSPTVSPKPRPSRTPTATPSPTPTATVSPSPTAAVTDTPTA